MAKYTTELISIIRQFSGDEDLPIRDQIRISAPKIFNFDYPIWEESHRQVLNEKILKHYIRHEIAQETFGLWNLFLDTTMNEIMPYYNELYLTTLEKFDGTNEIDLTTILHRDIASKVLEEGKGTNEDTAASTGMDYPQAKLSPSDAAYYASQGQSAHSNTSGTSERNQDTAGNEDTTTTRRGRTGARSQGDLILAFRNAIINIDEQICENRKIRLLFLTLK